MVIHSPSEVSLTSTHPSSGSETTTIPWRLVTPVSVPTRVETQARQVPGEITQQAAVPRSYLVETPLVRFTATAVIFL